MEQPTKSPYLTHTGLRNRPGWSPAVIAHYLPQPDALRKNPHYRSAAPTKLYLLTKIEAVEQQADWQQQALAVNRRKQAGRRASETKRANLLAYVDGLTITVPVMDAEQLTELACAHYNARQMYRQQEYGTDWQEATPSSDPTFLNRITVNYLRHQLTRYEHELERIAGKVGVDEAYERLKTVANQAILDQYPHLQS